MVKPQRVVDRFLKNVEKSEGCWLWTGTTAGSNARYGYFREGSRSTDERIPAHRFAYELWVGPIPEGLEIDHVAERGCTSKLCVNPEHLEAVTHKENRRRARLRVCRAGKHDLTDPENALWDLDGNRRGCKLCARERALARYYKMKEKNHGSL